MSNVSVILNVYKRPYTLLKQIEAIREQTIPVEYSDIHIWINTPEDIHLDLPELPSEDIKVYHANYNTKFFGRFTIPLMCRTEFICILDDDIIPGTKWLENCVKTMETGDYILGASGVITNGKTYIPNSKVGWNGKHSSSVEKVDLVGHAWFFRQEHAKLMWEEKPPSWDNGEDMFFSYVAQKHGIDTMVPPHPENNPEIWGNIPGRDKNWGFDKNAHSLSVSNHLSLRNDIVRELIRRGWKTIK